MTDSGEQKIARELGETSAKIDSLKDGLNRIEDLIRLSHAQATETKEEVASLKTSVANLHEGQKVLFAKTDRIEEANAGLKTKVAGIASILGGAAAWAANHFKIGS